jgi:hypothetical protein
MVNLKKYVHTRELFYIQQRFTKMPFLFYNYADVKKDLTFITNKNLFSHFSSKYLLPFNDFFSFDFSGPFFLTPFVLNNKNLNKIKASSLIGAVFGNFVLNRSDTLRLHRLVSIFNLHGFTIVSSPLSSFFFNQITHTYKLFIFLLFNYAYFKSINS